LSQAPLQNDLDIDRPTALVVYRCSCGSSFEVDYNAGGECPGCKRKVSAYALRVANSATLSIDHLNPDHDFHPQDETHQDSFDKGKMLGHFRLEDPIGRGGMGTVYRALDTSLQRYVAVKIIRPTKAGSRERVANSLREAVAQARLNHPNVVTIYYVGRHEEEPFLAMELVVGQTVAEQIRTSGAVRYELAIDLIIQVAQALEHASQFDIVHADIKPSNLLLAADGGIKLSDFGLARTLDARESSIVAGTPAYLAPELISGEAISIQSDMYALGVTLFEMVFGRLPFRLEEKSLSEQLQILATASVDFPTPWPVNIPKGFQLVLKRLLAKSPDERYPSYAALLDDLRSVQPARTTIAGLAARALAYSIDQIVLLACLSPFAIGILYVEASRSLPRILVPLLALASLIVPAIYLALMWRGWSSLGRYLLQLRITEEHGLPPGREQLVTREILRNLVAWVGPLASYFSLFYSPLDYILFAVVALFILAEVLSVFLSNYRRTLHDLLCHSRVILDVRDFRR
jgi:eukaryotic-like serine/threonine-protein kinase